MSALGKSLMFSWFYSRVFSTLVMFSMSKWLFSSSFLKIPFQCFMKSSSFSSALLVFLSLKVKRVSPSSLFWLSRHKPFGSRVDDIPGLWRERSVTSLIDACRSNFPLFTFQDKPCKSEDLMDFLHIHLCVWQILAPIHEAVPIHSCSASNLVHSDSTRIAWSHWPLSRASAAMILAKPTWFLSCKIPLSFSLSCVSCRS